MQKNEERFTDKANIYKQFRPSYSKELIEYLYSQAGFNQESIIADIGSGTGILSRLLIERGSLVYCVEPNDDMRQTAENDLSEFDNFISINSPAENLSLQNESVNFVTVAQAFHWFNREMFKTECQRILKPGGKVVLIWNERDYQNEIVKKDFIIREKYAIDKKGLGIGGGFKHEYQKFFIDGIFDYKKFNNDLQFNKDGFIGRNLSASYAPKKEQHPEKYHGLVNELSELFDKYSIDGILNYPHFSECYIGRV